MCVSNELNFHATRICRSKFTFILIIFCIFFWSDILYGYEKFRFGTIFFMMEPEKLSVCCDHLCREAMVMEQKLLDFANVILLQYKSCCMCSMHVIQDLPASPHPSTTYRSARFTTVQPEKQEKFLHFTPNCSLFNGLEIHKAAYLSVNNFLPCSLLSLRITTTH